MIEWQITEAKNRLSEVVTLALTKGPQRVHRRNQSVIVVAEREYLKLKGKRSPFIEYLLKAPSLDGLDLTRDASPSRDISL